MNAEELIKQESNFMLDDYEEIENLMIKFAKYHVELALRAAVINAKLSQEYGWGTLEHPDKNTTQFVEIPIRKTEHYGQGDCTYEILKVSDLSILNAYPLENIK